MSAPASPPHEHVDLARRFLALFPAEVMADIVATIEREPTAQARLDFKGAVLVGVDCTACWRRKRADDSTLRA